MSSELFGTLDDGTAVHRWTLERGGTRVRVLTYGAVLQSVRVPDRDGEGAEVVLGHPDLDGYLRHPDPYLGAVVGRYANRIAGGAFTLDGWTYTLPQNNGANTLHGGYTGFDKRVWDAQAVADGVRLTLVSEDDDEGFPGRLEVTTTYTLDADGGLRVVYEATTDAPTHLNLTQHTYWNLGGAGDGTVGDHELRIAAEHYTAVDEELIPTPGGPTPVAGTRFDFREARKVGAGFDHNYVLDGFAPDGSAERVVAELYEAGSGRVLTVATTEPGVQLYTGDHLDGEPFGPGEGVALETQHFPDSPNRPDYPSTVLRPEERFRSVTHYTFSTRAAF
ncbi:aldose epimerase family protein [Streptomyces sp. NPDC060194]|uniref:aldose epimerase family protein n=1 Tax=Streptomyces sp. NPDC060194 TaxID=3347069 RepID=UPI00364E98EF